jgi:hypothetical protein
MGKVADGWRVLRRCPPGLVVRRLAGRIWGRRVFYELRAELGELEEPRSADIPIRMMPAGPGEMEAALWAEAPAATGADYLQVMYLRRFLEARVEQPLVAHSADGKPVYCQWLIRPRDHARLQAAMPGRYRDIATGEVLLEGAYTFLGFRGLGAMADGMSQLLRSAETEGYTHATTYVAADNPAALKGCARAGFRAFRAHVATHRFGRRRERLVGASAAPEPWMAPRRDRSQERSTAHGNDAHN